MGSGVSFLLGLIQGATEFLPVSSSGHLALMQQLFSVKGDILAYNVLLHFATMLATVVYFRSDMAFLFVQWCRGFLPGGPRNGEGWSFGWAVIAGTAVTAAVGLPLKSVVEWAMTAPGAVGAGLLLTGAILWRGSSIAPAKGNGGKVSLYQGLCIGAVQGLAVLPGISRSGSTIVAGLKTGLPRDDAFRFSFLLSLPAILGATLLEMKDLLELADWSSSLPHGWLAGTAAAFLSGYAALGLLRRLVSRGSWRPLAVYCAVLGVISIILSFPG